MGGGVERDLMSGGSSLRDEGKIFVVVAGGDYKEGRLYSGTVQRGQNVRRRLAGAAIYPYLPQSITGRHLQCYTPT